MNTRDLAGERTALISASSPGASAERPSEPPSPDAADRALDEALLETFPASDPLPWRRDDG